MQSATSLFFRKQNYKTQPYSTPSYKNQCIIAWLPAYAGLS